MERPVPRLVSDAEYLERYEREARAYVARYDPRRHRAEAGKEHLRALRWAWIDDGERAAVRWARYAAAHPRLKALAADGKWRDWTPPTVRKG